MKWIKGTLTVLTLTAIVVSINTGILNIGGDDNEGSLVNIGGKNDSGVVNVGGGSLVTVGSRKERLIEMARRKGASDAEKGVTPRKYKDPELQKAYDEGRAKAIQPLPQEGRENISRQPRPMPTGPSTKPWMSSEQGSKQLAD